MYVTPASRFLYINSLVKGIKDLFLEWKRGPKHKFWVILKGLLGKWQKWRWGIHIVAINLHNSCLFRWFSWTVRSNEHINYKLSIHVTDVGASVWGNNSILWLQWVIGKAYLWWWTTQSPAMSAAFCFMSIFMKIYPPLWNRCLSLYSSSETVICQIQHWCLCTDCISNKERGMAWPSA